MKYGLNTPASLTPLTVPDSPIYTGLSLGPQDARGPPTNCGAHRVNCRYMII